MKNEGRQQGVVRTGMIHPRGFNQRPTNPPPANGVKVSSSTTSQSNIIGVSERSKYSNCHVSPAIKTGHKSKGRRKSQPTSCWSDEKLDRLIGSDSSSAQDILDTLCDEEDDEH
ncbi:PREDICTED: uncharacterized protein LOC104714544 [Camelina sativa]|uniref:Uncharacterized protein LOC104714544 n=1 Tax=Camelina sativa TaxID=90675 RepID=A0ABM0TRR3_CAMSA|nr:PREDICTED: uncharacterized protein LOC104714544 [Camelina sativa]XP_010430258.1 PREDICTED: uncharacterized protein LOC104714544 [Camelina sativa]XP_010430266.1 PREDICTED: uncharacterized protein LOC104714544 [Camelina sativa]